MNVSIEIKQTKNNNYNTPSCEWHYRLAIQLSAESVLASYQK